MDNEQIRKVVEHFKDEGGIRVRDIAFILLSHMFTDSKIAYQCLFDEKGAGFDEYSTDEMREKLENYMTEQGYIRSVSTDSDTGGLTFEENRKAMEQMLVSIQRDMQNGIIEPKDAYARMTDIRTKLNDKFKVEAQKQDRMIIVEKKYNHICERYHCECYLPTKEDLMEMYNLTEKPE